MDISILPRVTSVLLKQRHRESDRNLEVDFLFHLGCSERSDVVPITCEMYQSFLVELPQHVQK